MKTQYSKIKDIKVRLGGAGLFIGFLAVFLWALPALAGTSEPQTIPCIPGLPCINSATQLSGQATRSHFFNVVGANILTMFLGAAGVAAVVFIIIGGLRMHAALGNEEEIKKAKNTIIWAVFGLVLCILSVAIVQIISSLPFQPTSNR